MDDLKELYDLIPQSYVAQTLMELQSLYDEIQVDTEAFRTDYDISCPDGCGDCCIRFIPDVTSVEARMIAAYLLFVKQDRTLLDRLVQFSDGVDFGVQAADGSSLPGCPLYDISKPHHCMVYPARPLVCRLFGSCASDSKNGTPEFRRCKLNEENHMPVYLDLAGQDVPVMREYGLRARAIEGANDTVALLPQAVLEAASQLQYIAMMLGIDMNPDDNPDGNPTTPAPIAS